MQETISGLDEVSCCRNPSRLATEVAESRRLNALAGAGHFHGKEASLHPELNAQLLSA